SDAGFSSNNKLSTIKFGTEFDGANATSMASMFKYCNKLTSIEGIENVHTRKVTDMSYMFAYTDSLTELHLKSFDTSRVTNCTGMFAYDSTSNNLTKVYASTKFVIKNNTAQKVFASGDGVNKLKGSRNSTATIIKTEDASGFDSAEHARIDGLDGKKGYFIAECSTVVLSRANFRSMFTGQTTDKVVHVKTEDKTLSEVQYIPGVVDIESTTQNEKTDCYIFAWREGNIVYWWTDAEIVYMTNCSNLLQNCVIKEFSFEGFDVTKLQNASYMFSGCSSLEKVTFGNEFYTDSLNNTSYMFNGCSSLTTLNLSSFDMTKVTNNNNNVSGMFNGCSKLTTIYANTTFDYSSKNIDMFSGCSMLVGGSGTAYADMPTTNNNSNQKKSKYACIDGGTTKPGYFTRKTD
ncbi:MAG: BspA family leucine-rich repeat surface protein, partial [Lachnospiraceae bacterium]|nr:BspA family leucine-rich repeat surface protein [Lachnospiraceae bacterium]